MNDLKQIGIKQNILEEIRTFAKRYELSRVILFGSRARGDQKERSDIDLAVSGGNITGFSLAVDENTNTLLKFDIVNLDASVQEELLQSIEREGVMIYEKI
ncbi:MAG: nucleotidyltransferase domain-containing protein [Lachnospiraceae bacterium]|nr:nucleotidyltransferase domain-containing protein [Lachnospiraceae bacterium]